MASDINARTIVLNILIKVLEQNELSHITIRRALDKYSDLSQNDKAFINRLSEGTIERLIEEDYIINMFSKIKVKKMKPVIRNILRMSVYQIRYMDSVPDSAVCNEAVKLASKRGLKGLKGFVNGVLRNIIREKESIKIPEDNLSVLYSMPQWIIDLWDEEYGRTEMINMLKALENDSRICIRRNTSFISHEQFVKMLKDENVDVTRSDIVEYAYYINNNVDISKLNSFEEGYFQVQDLSSILVGSSAGVCENMICVDVCAAPGGKSMHIADLLDGTGKVYSRDLTEEKVKLIDENINRNGFENVFSKVWDATREDKDLIGKCDLVICDLPCSGLGVMSKKSDIKYKTSLDDITNLSRIQKEILNVSVKYLKNGGHLIFSTCTVNKTENDNNVDYIKNELGLEGESLEGYIPKEIYSDTISEGYIQIMPGQFGMDGFFISRFVKK